MNDIDTALEIAVKAHRGQKDKAGEAYILHPLYVMNHVYTEKEKIIAILHDVVEDSDYTFDDLIKAGINDEEIIEALRLLTRDKDKMEYKEYLLKLKDNKLARNVKLADLKHHLDRKQISASLTDRYVKAVGILKYDLYIDKP